MDERALVEPVAAIWAEVLDVPSAPSDVPFFDAGGDSILLIALLERLNALGAAQLEPPDLFRHNTVRAQAALLAGAARPAPVGGTPDRSALLRRAERGRTDG